MSKDRKHLSASQLEMFARCPESWRRRYIEKEIIPPRLAMLKGTAVHAGAEHNMRQKIESHQDLPSGEIVEAAVNAYETTIKVDGYVLGKDETKLSIDKMKNVVAEMALVHAIEQAPEYQPVAVEEKFRIELPTISHDLVGVIDLQTTDKQIVDFKTSGKSLSQQDADASPQLSLYAAAKQAEQEEIVVKLDVLVEPSARKPVRRQVIESRRNKTDLPIVARRVAVVSKQIDAGLFPPAPVGSWWCNDAWCGYWSTCPYVNSERIAAAKQVREAMQVLEGESE